MTTSRMFVDPTTLLGASMEALERAWGPGLPGSEASGGSRRVVWLQRWFGEDGLKASYIITAEGLQSITITAPTTEQVLRAMREDLGVPDEEGRSPNFLNSDSYCRWVRDGVDFTLEDYVPGCSVVINRIRP